MAKTHPHIDVPTAQQLIEVYGQRPPQLLEVYLELHKILVETFPDIVNSVDTVDAVIGYGARQYGYNGWGMAAVMPYSKWVSLTMMQGSHLEDPERLLTGTAVMRHIKVSALTDIDKNRAAIAALVRAAAALYAHG